MTDQSPAQQAPDPTPAEQAAALNRVKEARKLATWTFVIYVVLGMVGVLVSALWPEVFPRSWDQKSAQVVGLCVIFAGAGLKLTREHLDKDDARAKDWWDLWITGGTIVGAAITLTTTITAL